MRNGYPDYHQLPERDHGDESFWPSFTDIMMVITMVFLLVSVMAIMNNWNLVTDLKASIQAERLAAEQALDKEAQNNTLEDQMVMLQKRLVDANKVAVDKQVANEALQEELSRILAKVSKIETELEASLKKVQEREKQLAISSEQVDTLRADRDKQLATLQARAQALNNLQSIQESSQAQVTRLQAALDQKQSDLQEANTDSTTKIESLEAALASANAALRATEKTNEAQLAALEDSLRQTRATLDASQERLRQTEASLDTSQESQQLSVQQLETLRSEVSSLEKTRRDEAAALASLRAEMATLQDLRAEDIVKLQTLKDEFDSLDVKYQKLVRPARSSEGKHVVSVWFSKQTGREVYRIRDGSAGAFTNTTRRNMAATLSALKDKYGKELYVKVIIPENSGLSYSDAWRFTTEMQREFDYYYQDDE